MRDARKTDLPDGKLFKKLAITLHYSVTTREKLSLPFSVEGIVPLTMGCLSVHLQVKDETRKVNSVYSPLSNARQVYCHP